jgi:hypothetical protein
MSVTVFKNVVVLVDGFRLSRHMNELRLKMSREVFKTGTLDDGPRRTKGGWSGEWEFKLWDDAAADWQMLRMIADTARTKNDIVVLPEGGAAGQFAVFFQSPVLDRPFNAQDGKPREDTLSGKEADQPFIGTILYSGLEKDGHDGPVTADTNGDAVVLGALDAGKKLTCFVQRSSFPVLVGADTEVTPELQSSVSGDFTVPQVVHTFAPITADPATHRQVFTQSGDTTPNTDTNYRLVFHGFASTDPAPSVSPVGVAIIE